jgi:hypothetical protein
MKTETPRLVEFLIVTGVLSLVSVGMFGAFGAIVHYLYTVVKNEGSEFKFGAMATFALMGFFVALLINSLLIDFTGRSYEGLLLLSGFLVIRILEFLDQSGLMIALSRVGIKVPHKEK